MGAIIDNPVLSKELRSRLRSRKQGKANRNAAIILAGSVVVLMYYFGVRAILRTPSVREAHDMYLIFTVMIQTTLILFLVPALTSGAITQEREQQTWNALLLSRLTPEEIVIGKLIACLMPAVLILGIFAPLNLLSAIVGHVGIATYLVSNLLLLTASVFYATISLFCSWAYRRTYIATAAAFGTAAAFAVGTVLLYGLWTMAHPGTSIRPETFMPLWVNPYMALIAAIEGPAQRDLTPALFHIFVSVIGSLALIGIMIGRLSHGPKELEQ